MITIHTRNELTEFLNSNDLPSLVGAVSFAGDLLASVRSTCGQIAIDDELGFADDGGWIEIDENGVVVDDRWIP